MAIEIPSSTTQYNIEEESETYFLRPSSTVEVSGNESAIFQASGVDDDIINIRGTVIQTGTAFAAVVLSGVSDTFHVFGTGSVSGNTGVEFIGADGSLINSGTITSNADFGSGVYFEGASMEITNNHDIFAKGASSSAIFASGENSEIYSNGKLKGTFGINIDEAKTTIVLDTNSKVTGSEAAIFANNTEATEKVHVTNQGSITGTAGVFAIELADGNDTIINHGDIFGKIYLGSGKDIFDNRGGSVDHAIQGGAGDDTLITDSASVKLKENGGSEGYDTVRSTVSYTLSANVEKLVLLGTGNTKGTGTSDGDDLFGNRGDNKLFGLQGVDHLSGGKGNDQLTGGAGADTFIFSKGFEHDTITDFQNGIDKIDVTHWAGIDQFSDVKSHLTASHGDLFITLGSDQLIIENMTKAQLNASDFDFPA